MYLLIVRLTCCDTRSREPNPPHRNHPLGSEVTASPKRHLVDYYHWRPCQGLQKRNETLVQRSMRRELDVHFRQWTVSGGVPVTTRCALVQSGPIP